MPKDYFDEPVASRYDSDTDISDPAAVEPVVQFLADLAGDEAALELGVGTGRIALPLSRRGVRVHGIDLSTAMVAQLRAKPGSDDIGVTIGDFATTRVEGTFGLAYLVYNTIQNLGTQEAQVECFGNVAAHLTSGGSFVIEVEVPPLRRLPPRERVKVFALSPSHLEFDEIDVATQQAVSHHYWTDDSRVRTFSMPYRYVWPSELDLMARLAGMALQQRWGGWTREPFTAESRKHVSVWEKDG